MSQSTGIATLAGGCFWCIEAVFDALQGVTSVESGYTGGTTSNPTYTAVCHGDTGHAEAIRIEFDPNVIGFRDLLDVFFTIHDPTTRNRQGNDVGTQYRSAIFYHDADQKRVADQTIAELTRAQAFAQPIVTEVTAAGPFYVAEDYHQGYFASNGEQPYCQLVVAPKFEKFRQKFAARLKQ
jgi:peptide-methionine (S)-S-oxide reductase